MAKIGQKNYKIEEAVAELVDNSIDAKCKEEPLLVKVIIKKDNIIVEDDGTGMTKKEFEGAAVLGESAKKDKLGLYGLGLKTACMNLGRKFTITSTSKGTNKKYIFTFDLDTWLKNEELNWDKYDYEEILESWEAHYTHIKIERLSKDFGKYYDREIRRLENRIISDFGMRYASMIKRKDTIIKVSNSEVPPEFPLAEESSRIDFDFLLDEEDPKTCVHGWVGLNWDPIRKKIVGSQKGQYGFTTYRNGRLITRYDNLKVDNETFALRKHPQWAAITGVVNMDSVPVENDKRNFIQENPMYVETVKRVRPYVEKIEKEIKQREEGSEIATDIKDITEELVLATEEALNDKDIKQLVEDNATEEGLANYGAITKMVVAGKEIRGNNLIEADKEFRESSKSKDIGTVQSKNPEKIRLPNQKIQKGKIKEIEKVQDEAGEIEIELGDEKIEIKHLYVDSLVGDSLRAWEKTDKNKLIVKTNIAPIKELTGKELPVFALHNICESLSEFCLNTNEVDKLIDMRDNLIKTTYKIISTNINL